MYGKGFIPGRKVYIKLNGLYAGIVYGSLQIGSLYEGTVSHVSCIKEQSHVSHCIKEQSHMSHCKKRTVSQVSLYNGTVSHGSFQK